MSILGCGYFARLLEFMGILLASWYPILVARLLCKCDWSYLVPTLVAQLKTGIDWQGFLLCSTRIISFLFSFFAWHFRPLFRWRSMLESSLFNLPRVRFMSRRIKSGSGQTWLTQYCEREFIHPYAHVRCDDSSRGYPTNEDKIFTTK